MQLTLVRLSSVMTLSCELNIAVGTSVRAHGILMFAVSSVHLELLQLIQYCWLHRVLVQLFTNLQEFQKLFLTDIEPIKANQRPLKAGGSRI